MKRFFLLAFAFLCLLPASYSQLVLNEIASTNDSLLMDQFGGFPDWIELYNNSGSSIPLSGYYLSDDAATPQKWAFPAGITIDPFDYVLVFASDSNSSSGAWAHTNFKISSGGETILLSDPGGSLLDQIQVPPLLTNDSYGRDTDGSTSLAVFDDPTPEASNNPAISYSGYCDDQVIFSLTAGFHTGSQSLTLSGPAQIRFTRDGSMPDANSQLYTGPITVDTTQVIRAACFSAGTLFERAYTNTYLINENTIFPVFSLSTDPDNFFDWNTGIYVKGPNASSSFPYFGANFHEDWERPIHVEFFDTSGVRHIVQDAGVKIFGNYSRGNNLKSIRLIARNKYGDNRFEYKFFSDKNISSFKQVVLRNAGDDYQVANMRDPVNRLIARDLELVDGMAYTPSVVFLNGVYWGMHGLREKIHENYIEANHGVSADSVVILNFDGTVAAGDSFDFQAFSQQISNVDMSVQANYDLWQDSVDVWNLADYFIHNIHFVNEDWPWKNVRLWRSTDRKWPIRYISYDLDGTFELFGIGPPQTNKINGITGGNGMHENLLNAFLGNPGYQDYFINRYADLMNTSFHPANVIGIVDSMETLLSPEMQRHIPRWGNLSFGGWQWYVNQLRGFASDRMPFSRNQLENTFSLDGQVEVTLAVSPAGAGFIKMNTVYPDTFPWTGVYYDGVPVTMTAHSKPGYTFDHWQSTSLVPNPDVNTSLTLNVDVDDTFTAYFTGSPAALELTISEINYNSLGGQNPGDWIELFNYGTAPVDISGWTLRDDQDFHVYTFPSGTVISNNEYLVVCEDLVAFDSVHTTVSNRIGELGFSLSNSGDEIRLYNLQGNLYLSMAFDDQNGWPQEADGDGNTLELADPLVSLSDTANWFAGCLLGSPGGPFAGPCDTVSAAVVNFTVSEINYNSASFLDMGDWFELFNYGPDTVDLTGWTMEDNDPTHIYSFPMGTLLAPGNRLLVANDPSLLSTIHPGISVPILGPIGFGLGNTTDQINLKDDLGAIYLSLTYSDAAPWPQLPDGDGYTLELVDEQVSLSDPNNWFAGCFAGSPGEAHSTPCDTVIAPSTEEVVISEINYNSSPLLDAGDWLEVYNYGNADVDLTGWSMRDSDTANVYLFPTGTMLAAGERLVVSADLAAFDNVFPAVSNVLGPLGFGLSGSGEQIRLLNAGGLVLLDVTYDDQAPWPTSPDGEGYTLELLDETANLDDAANWFAGCYGGSPGTAYTTPCPLVIPEPDFTVSEINYHAADTADSGDWIELYNYGLVDADLSGWVFQDSDQNNGFIIPSGTLLLAGQRLVIANDLMQFSAIHPGVSNVIGDFGFDLGDDGDEINLFDTGATLYLSMTYQDQLPWPLEADGQGYTLELVSETGILSSGTNWFAGCPGGSPGTPFIGPCDTSIVVPLPDLTISEINYNSNSAYNAGDWVELWNFGADTADLSAWIMRDDNDNNGFTIPQGTSILPGERLVISNDLTAFATMHTLVFNVIGPFNFGLGNSGDSIRLFTPSGDLFQSMRYADNAPWPTTPDGEGYTLELIDETGDLNAATNWSAGCFGGSPGTYFTAPCPPPPTAIDPSFFAGLRVYPNPGPGLFQIEIDGMQSTVLTIRVLNSLGQEILGEELRPIGSNTVYELDLRSHPKGVYVLMIAGGEQNTAVRLVIE